MKLITKFAVWTAIFSFIKYCHSLWMIIKTPKCGWTKFGAISCWICTILYIFVLATDAIFPVFVYVIITIIVIGSNFLVSWGISKCGGNTSFLGTTSLIMIGIIFAVHSVDRYVEDTNFNRANELRLSGHPSFM